jgi:hypothetical protein
VNTAAPRPARRYRCQCQRVFQFFGGGRHRRFYELDDLRWLDPLMTRRCPSCQRRLPITRGPLKLEATAPQHRDDAAVPATTRLESAK